MISSLFVSQFWQSWQFWQSVLHLTIQELGLRAVFTITLAVALALPGLAQTSDDPVAQGQKRAAVRITHGPVVELVTDTTAQVAWSTNVNAGTTLHYGTNPTNLDQTRAMPWGGLTHRVELHDLKSNTTYYFKAESDQGQHTGTRAEAMESSFQTKPAGVHAATDGAQPVITLTAGP